LSLPGEEVYVEAYLSRTGLTGLLNPGIQGELLTFRNNEGEPLGSRLTDPTGMARIRFQSSRQGVHTVSVSLAGNPRYEAAPAKGSVFVRSRRHPLFFVWVEGTLREQESPSLLWRKPVDAVPVPGSVEAVKKLSSCLTLAYLTSQPMVRMGPMRSWLEKHAYPPGPLLLLNRSPGLASLQKPSIDLQIPESLWKDRSLRAYIVTGDRSIAEAAGKKSFHVFLLVEEEKTGSPPPGKPEEAPSAGFVTEVRGWEDIPMPCGTKGTRKNTETEKK
jgi:hypothetical protein